MNIHKNARLIPHGRERMVQMMLSGHTPEAASRAVGVCPRTARKWLARYKAEGTAGLQDRSSRPKTLRKPTAAKTVKRIIALRRQRWTAKHIARETGVSSATVSRVLKRAGLSRLKDLEPAEPVRRYERSHTGPDRVISFPSHAMQMESPFRLKWQQKYYLFSVLTVLIQWLNAILDLNFAPCYDAREPCPNRRIQPAFE